MYSFVLTMKDINKQYTELMEWLSDLNEFRAIMISQIDTMNRQFKINIIDKFSDFGVVQKIKEIWFNGVSI